MTLRTAFLVGAIGLGHTSAWAQTVRVGTGEPIVHVGVIVHRPDGGLGAAATSTGEQVGADMAGTVYLAPCASVGAASPGRPVSASATEVWQLSGSVLELTPEQASVQIGWQRIRRGGREEASAPKSVTLTLKRGERVTLENITVPLAGSCEAAYASLSVLLATRGEFFRVNGTSSASNAASGGRAGTKVFTGSRGGSPQSLPHLPATCSHDASR